MYPKIGIVICGFHEDRQFVPNVYIQSIRYSKGIPFLIPLVRSDRLINEYVHSCDGLPFLRRGRYHPAAVRRRTAKRKRKDRHHRRPLPDTVHETHPCVPQACPCSLPGNADLKRRMRRYSLAGSFPCSPACTRSHAAFFFQRRCQPPDQN